MKNSKWCHSSETHCLKNRSFQKRKLWLIIKRWKPVPRNNGINIFLQTLLYRRVISNEGQQPEQSCSSSFESSSYQISDGINKLFAVIIWTNSCKVTGYKTFDAAIFFEFLNIFFNKFANSIYTLSTDLHFPAEIRDTLEQTRSNIHYYSGVLRKQVKILKDFVRSIVIVFSLSKHNAFNDIVRR